MLWWWRGRSITVALSVARTGGMRTSSALGSAATRFTYTLPSASRQDTLYIPLTSYCNSLTLPQTRGPNFVLPSNVVAALCRVRDAESGVPKWHHWCQWLDGQESLQKLPLPADSYVARLPHNHNGRPTVTELVHEVESYIQAAAAAETAATREPNGGRDQDGEWTLVIGGEGEPTLRREALVELVHRLRVLRGVKRIRITTNGLVCPDDARAVWTAMDSATPGLIVWSVALTTHHADTYHELLQPLLHHTDSTVHSNSNSTPASWDCVVSFIRCALEAGYAVETTAVHRPTLVDPTATNALSAALGVSHAVRWRPYFS